MFNKLIEKSIIKDHESLESSLKEYLRANEYRNLKKYIRKQKRYSKYLKKLTKSYNKHTSVSSIDLYKLLVLYQMVNDISDVIIDMQDEYISLLKSKINEYNKD